MHAGQSRGYAFIEYENKKDMKEAYKMADGKKIEGKRVVVDVERGRTVDNWCVCRPGCVCCWYAKLVHQAMCTTCVVASMEEGQEW